MFKIFERLKQGWDRPAVASVQRWALVTVICLVGGSAEAHTVMYDIDQNTASIRFSTHIVKFIPFDGAFTSFTGHIQLDPTRPASIQIDVVVDDGAMTAPYGGAKTLQSTAYFDQEQFPTIQFRSDTVQVLPGDHFTIIGRLTIRGISHRQTLDGTITHVMVGGVPAMRILARSQLKRSDFGMVTDRSFIANQVTLNIATTLRIP